MLCHCSSHPVTRKRDFVTVISPRVTERHAAAYCARTNHGKQPVHMIGTVKTQWSKTPSPVRFERLDR